MSDPSRRGSPLAPSVDAVLADALVDVGAGDRDAFDFVYRATWEPLHARVTRVLRDAELAEEVTQEVLAEVWQRAMTFDPRAGRAMSWLMTIAHHRAVDRVRSVEASRRREHEDLQQRLPLVAEDLAADVALRLDHEVVRAALVHLSPLQREAVVLAFYDGHTHREVADLLGIPLSTAKARIRDGLLRLARAVRATGLRAPAED